LINSEYADPVDIDAVSPRHLPQQFLSGLLAGRWIIAAPVELH
jgi:hypothetical protein